MTTSTLSREDLLARATAKVVEAKARAAAVRATLSPELLAEVAARCAEFEAKFATNCFCGPDNGHGRQEVRMFSDEEVAAWWAARS